MHGYKNDGAQWHPDLEVGIFCIYFHTYTEHWTQTYRRGVAVYVCDKRPLASKRKHHSVKSYWRYNVGRWVNKHVSMTFPTPFLPIFIHNMCFISYWKTYCKQICIILHIFRDNYVRTEHIHTKKCVGLVSIPTWCTGIFYLWSEWSSLSLSLYLFLSLSNKKQMFIPSALQLHHLLKIQTKCNVQLLPRIHALATHRL